MGDAFGAVNLAAVGACRPHGRRHGGTAPGAPIAPRVAASRSWSPRSSPRYWAPTSRASARSRTRCPRRHSRRSPPTQMRELFGAALAVAALAAIESLLSAKVADGMADTGRHDPDRELFGQGLANIASSMFGGMPATGAIARTAVNVRAGARTRVSAIVHSAALDLDRALRRTGRRQDPARGAGRRTDGHGRSHGRTAQRARGVALDAVRRRGSGVDRNRDDRVRPHRGGRDRHGCSPQSSRWRPWPDQAPRPSRR